MKRRASVGLGPELEGELWTGTAPSMSPVDESTAAEWQELAQAALDASPGSPGAIIAVSDRTTEWLDFLVQSELIGN